MTDEELGRQWCKKNGRVPDYTPWHHRPDRPWRWVCNDGLVYALPTVLYDQLGMSRHATESDAYAAVGAALRELRAKAKEIAEVLGEVPGE